MNRPESTRDGALFDLQAVADELRREDAYAREGHTARTLVREADLRIVLVAMRAGSHIAAHRAKETASIHALSGRLRLALPRAPVELAAGRVLVLAEQLEHDVHALEDSTLLLTLGWRPRT